MRELLINDKDAGQRLDKYLKKYLNEAGSGFIYKMLRKKNIKLNDGKAQGNEILKAGDVVRLYLSEETIGKFMSTVENRTQKAVALDVVYEDRDVLFLNKPAGMLSQKADRKEDSAAEYVRDYIERTRGEELRTFRPAPVNRLDRNTSGLLLCGTSHPGLRFLSGAINERTIKKYYLTVVSGEMNKPGIYEVWFRKSQSENKVSLSHTKRPGDEKMITGIEPLAVSGGYTLLNVDLITGKPHQIRSHLAFLGFPVIGDGKYGDPEVNSIMKLKYGLSSQFLHSAKIVFPEVKGEFERFSGRSFEAPCPDKFTRILTGLGFGDMKTYE